MFKRVHLKAATSGAAVGASLRARTVGRQRRAGDRIQEAHAGAGGEELRQDDPLSPGGARVVARRPAAAQVLGDIADGGFKLDRGDPD